MNKEQLKHIFDNSACLTPRQLRSYAAGKMVHEEARAVEVHLLSCPFCDDALEGVKEQIPNGSLDAVENIDASFLKSHIGISNPEAQLKKASVPAPGEKLGRKVESIAKKTTLWRNIGIAASVLIVVGILWFMRDSIFSLNEDNGQIAQNTEPRIISEEEVPISNTPTDENIASTALADTMSMNVADNQPQEELTQQEQNTEEALATTETQKPPKEENKNKPELAKAETKPKKEEPVIAKADKAKEETKKTDATLTSATAGKTNLDEQYPQRLGNSYNAEEAASKKEEKKKPVADEPKPDPAANLKGIEKADYLYKEGKYRDALKIYQEEMFNQGSSKRDQATLKAAQCHKNLGEKTQAKTLLNSLIRDNSSLKGQAEKALEGM